MLNTINFATQCSVMLPLSANVMLPPSVQSIIHAEGVPRLRFDQDDVRFVLTRVRCGLPTSM